MAEKKESVEATFRMIRRATRKKCSAEERVRIVLEGLRGAFLIQKADQHHPRIVPGRPQTRRVDDAGTCGCYQAFGRSRVRDGS
jgi:hypothetical protein